ncbi:MAG: hypothetical protein LBS19_13455 [Clostridiales bacterium]|nr:hypothetical protein [Clostridiales bacterium]
MTRKQTAACIFLSCFLLSSSIPAFYISYHSSHRHDRAGAGGCCAVCERIQIACDLLKHWGFTPRGVITLILGVFAVPAALNFSRFSHRSYTPVSLGIRMNI